MPLPIEVPEELLQALKLPADEVPVRLKREFAVHLYARGLLTFGKARQLAEMSRWEFRDLVGEEGALRRYGVEELEQDLDTLEKID